MVAAGKAPALAFGAVGGLTSAALAGPGGGVGWIALAPVLGVAGVYVLVTLALGIVLVLSGIRATYASTAKAQKAAMEVFSKTAEVLSTLVLGARTVRKLDGKHDRDHRSHTTVDA